MWPALAFLVSKFRWQEGHSVCSREYFYPPTSRWGPSHKGATRCVSKPQKGDRTWSPPLRVHAGWLAKGRCLCVGEGPHHLQLLASASWTFPDTIYFSTRLLLIIEGSHRFLSLMIKIIKKQFHTSQKSFICETQL